MFQPSVVPASPQALPRIRALPPLLVNQIAAGEVVDRPASVVKELIDNAIDAGATRIDLELERGGIELIRVTDDGVGIHADDMPLALAAHATSKIIVAEDLDRIATMGFRGEALASIASVSRMTIRSRRRDDANERGGDVATGAIEIDVEGDIVSSPRPASGPIGTSVTVRNLFFNTPARRKFLRTPATEQGHCIDIAQELALAHPHIAVTITCDGKRSMDLPANQTPTRRALSVLGEELEDQFVVASADQFDDARGVALWGLVGLPALARANAKSQHVFLNGRPIRDKTIQHAIREAYRGLIEPGKYPTAVLMIEMDPGAVDVNVHPAKTEVRFRDSSLVHGVVLRAIRDALRDADLTPKVGRDAVGGHGAHNPGGEFTAPYRSLPTNDGRGASVAADGRTGDGGALPGRNAGPSSHAGGAGSTGFAEYFRRSIPTQVDGRLSYGAIRDAIKAGTDANSIADNSSGGSSAGSYADGRAFSPPTVSGRQIEGGAVGGDFAQDGVPNAPEAGSSDLHKMGDSVGTLPPALPVDRMLQIHNSYVVTQDEHGIVIIDQHALHERVMFEQLLSRVRAANLESQRMLVPSVVRAPARLMDRLDDLKPMLARIGIQLEPIGPDAVGVQSFPTFLFDRRVEPGEFTSELLERFDEEGFTPNDEQTMHEVLDMMACKAAIKAGDRMSDVELRDLLRLRDAVERSSNCPHGRPTSIRLTIKELEKRFGRA